MTQKEFEDMTQKEYEGKMLWDRLITGEYWKDEAGDIYDWEGEYMGNAKDLE